jgi:hypothetical protein
VGVSCAGGSSAAEVSQRESRLSVKCDGMMACTICWGYVQQQLSLPCFLCDRVEFGMSVMLYSCLHS